MTNPVLCQTLAVWEVLGIDKVYDIRSLLSTGYGIDCPSTNSNRSRPVVSSTHRSFTIVIVIDALNGLYNNNFIIIPFSRAMTKLISTNK